MFIRFSQSAVLAAALLLGACSYADNLFGTHWSGQRQNADNASADSYNIPPSAAEGNPQPLNSPSTYQQDAASTRSTAYIPNAASQAIPAGAPQAPVASASVVSGPNTGTVVGQKVQSLRADLGRLQANFSLHQQDLANAKRSVQGDAQSYFATIASINARLQTGTTAGNPELVAQWNQAQATLDRLSQNIGRLNTVSTQAAADSSFAAYLLNATRSAFALQGAVDEDHRQLTQIQTQLDTTTVQIDALLNAVTDEITRQSNYVANERENLITLSQAIKNGQLFGPSLASRSFGGAPSAAPVTPVARSAAPAPARSSAGPVAAAPAGDRPLVTIRFDRPDVSYEQALYTAVSRALERKPSASFDLVAVAPSGGNAAQVAVNSNASKRNAENVMRSLTNMGLPADRISLSATTSAEAQNNEVRLYVR